MSTMWVLQVGAAHDLVDHLVLGIGIILDEGPILCREADFRLGVQVAVGITGTKPVPEAHMPLNLPYAS